MSIAQSLFSKLAQPCSEIYVVIVNKSNSSKTFYLIYSFSESKPLPPPKPQLPAPKEPEPEVEETTTEESKPKMERAKSFVNVHKTSFQSERVIPNDDLVLNQARRQKSFVGPSAKKIAQLKIPGENKVNSIQRAASMGNLDKKEEIVRVRSLVEVDDYDGKC